MNEEQEKMVEKMQKELREILDEITLEREVIRKKSQALRTKHSRYMRAYENLNQLELDL